MYMNEEEIFKTLTSEQIQAIRQTEGYIRLIAGAGTGKTDTLARRYIYIKDILGVPPSDILLLTFSNKAAAEMQRRIKYLTRSNNVYPNITTIHSFCAKFLKENIFSLKFNPDFAILSQADEKELLKEIRKSNQRINKKPLKIKQMEEMVSVYKHTYQDLYINFITQPNIDDIDLQLDKNNMFIKDYLLFQRRQQNLFFDDLILFTIYILKHFDNIKENTAKKFSYIFVDEFQDTSENQYIILQYLSSYHKNLFVVGDPDQCIYTFNGSKVDIILNFDKDFNNTKTLTLTTNFRSSQEIIDTANRLISYNKHRYQKDLVSFKGKSNIKPRFFSFKYKEKEIDKIIDLIREYQEQHNSFLNNIAILYRNNALSKDIEFSLVRNKIPYRILLGTSFYERIEIKILLSYLKVAYLKDDMSLVYLSKRLNINIGPKKIQEIDICAKNNNFSYFDSLVYLAQSSKLFNSDKIKNFINVIYKIKDYLTKEKYISKILYFIYTESKYKDELMDINDEDRIENVQYLINVCEEYEKENQEPETINDYLNRINLIQEFYNSEEKVDAVTLLTCHTSKGSEYDHVIIYNTNDKIFPSSYATTDEQIEEERRLFFVSLTRARKTLDLTYSDGFFNGLSKNISPFIYEIQPTLECIPNITPKVVFKPSSELTNFNNANFQKGDRVESRTFGLGTVLSIPSREVVLVQFDELPTERKVFCTTIKKIEEN